MADWIVSNFGEILEGGLIIKYIFPIIILLSFLLGNLPYSMTCKLKSVSATKLLKEKIKYKSHCHVCACQFFC